MLCTPEPSLHLYTFPGGLSVNYGNPEPWAVEQYDLT